MDEGLFFVGLLGLAVAVAIAARRLEMPYTVALVAVGLVVGALHPRSAPRLTRESLYLIFLPGLIYEASQHLDPRTFLESKRMIVLLAVPGMLAAAALTSAALALCAPLAGMGNPRWVAGVLFGALISATDPTAVAALFRTLGAPRRLRTIVEGESLLNDAVAVVLFSMALEFATGTPFAPGRAALELVRVSCVGALVGAAFAGAVVWVGRYVADAVSRVALTTVAAYGSFLVAERWHASGIIATLVAGVLTTHARLVGIPGSADRAVVEACWDYATFALNSLVFLLVGFQSVQLGEVFRLWAPVVVAFLVVTATRAVVVAVATRCLRGSSEAMPSSWPTVLTWSGLRGPLSMVLVLDLPESLPERRLLVDITSGVVVLSILVQGATMTPLLRWLGVLERTKPGSRPDRSNAAVPGLHGGVPGQDRDRATR
jgi:CPA1 family monovalent cation:H+ antiporter